MAAHTQAVSEKGTRPSLHVSMSPTQRKSSLWAGEVNAKDDRRARYRGPERCGHQLPGSFTGLGSSTHIKTARTGTRQEHQESGLARRQAVRALEGLEQPLPRSPPGPRTCFSWVPVLGLDLCSFSCSPLSIALSRWGRFMKEKALNSH